MKKKQIIKLITVMSLTALILGVAACGQAEEQVSSAPETNESQQESGSEQQEAGAEQQEEAAEQKGIIAVEQPEEKAVALMKMRGRLCHVGLYAGDGYIIHSRHNLGAVCERLSSPQLAGCVEGWYRVDSSYSMS